MSRKHISLNRLETFESAGRLQSFKDAGEELFMTASAVSQAIKRLEEDLNCSLFYREHKGVRLTPVGERLLLRIQANFDGLKSAINEIQSFDKPNVSIGCPPLFANQILIPVLQDMLRDGAEFEFTLDSQFRGESVLNHAFDLAILYGANRDYGEQVLPIGVEYFVPVCSPAYAKTLRLEVLHEATLVVNDTEQVYWKDWKKLNKIAQPDSRKAVRFSLGLQAIAAARRGLGVLLESRTMLTEELESGALVEPFAKQTEPLAHTRHYLFRSPRAHYPMLVSEIASLISLRVESAVERRISGA